MTTDDLIELLGGRQAIAAQLRIKPEAVSNWKASGIPWRHHSRLAAMAWAAGVKVTHEMLAKMRPEGKR